MQVRLLVALSAALALGSTAVAGKREDRQAKELAEKLGDIEDFDGDETGENRITDIDQLVLPEHLRAVLVEHGFETIQSLAALSPEELSEKTGFEVDDSKIVCNATEAFLRVQRPGIGGGMSERDS